jgi:D-alanyl-D-alanine carboxypeptidase
MNEFELTEEHIRYDELPEMDGDSSDVSHTSSIPVVPQLSVALGLLVSVFAITYVGATHTLKKHSEVADVRVVATLPTTTPQVAEKRSHAFETVSVRARSVMVWDVEKQRVLFTKNADEQLPLASVTKLMTALVSYDLLNPEQIVPITSQALKVEGDSGFKTGETFSMRNLADLTLITSSNDGAVALSVAAGKEITDSPDAERAFVKAMNVKAEELGLTKTYFKNSTGLDLSPTTAGAYGSAHDVALLMEHVITQMGDAVARTKVDSTTIKNADGAYHTAENTNTVVDKIDGLIASKTGYTELAGGNLVIAFNAGLNRPVVIVVLNSTEEGRFTDILTLVKRARLYMEEESIQ